MSEDLGLGITLALKDMFSQNAQRIQRSYKSLDNTIAASTDRINQNMERVQKGAMVMGAGLAIMAVPAALISSTFETQKALGELRSLGIQDLNALSGAAEEFSNQWSGTTKAEFIAASYDIRSGISSLSDVAVAEFTKIAALTGKATKSSTAEMTSLFATGYGIYKNMYADLSDIAFGEVFSAGISQAVQAFKTTGSGMAESISRLGATATTANISLEEQLSILGMLQATMSGSEAGTKYKAFMKSAAKAGETLGLQFTDSNNRLLGMVPILQKLKGQYGKTLDEIEKQQLQKAFGTQEALAVIDLFYDKTGDLTGNIARMSKAMQSGTASTKTMADAMNIDPGAGITLLGQQLHNLFEVLGETLLPIITPVIQGFSGIILGAQWLAKTFPGVTRVVLGAALAIGGLLAVGGLLWASMGALGLILPSVNLFLATLGITATVTGASIASALAAAFWPVTIAVAAIYALKKAWDNNLGGIQTRVFAFGHGVASVWNGITSLISSGKISGALHQELQNLGLWGFVKTVYMVFTRLGQFFSGFFGQLGSAFNALGEAFYPVFSGIYAVIAPIGKLLFAIANGLGLVGAAVPSGAFKVFGEILGFVVGVPLRALAGMIKIITVPLQWLGKMIGWVIEKIASVLSAVPDFLLPKGLEGVKKGLVAGSAALAMTTTPALAAAQNTLLPATAETAPATMEQTPRLAQLLAEKNTNYYQTFNNQRSETANVVQAPSGVQEQPPINVNLHLDGRVIHREMINRDREQGVRKNG